MKPLITALFALVAGILPLSAGTHPPATDVITPTEPASDWRCRVALYGFAESLGGDVSAAGISTPLEMDFDEILDHLDYAVMGAMEIGHGRWSVLADAFYAKLSASADTPFGFVADELDIELKQLVGHLVVGYEVARTECVTFGVYGGARVNWIELNLDLASEERSADKCWVDPIIGARFQAELSDSFFFRAIGDVGGFGVSSDFTWQAMAGFGYRFNESCSLLLTYRAIGTDYTDGGFTYDIVAKGPFLGLEFYF